MLDHAPSAFYCRTSIAHYNRPYLQHPLAIPWAADGHPLAIPWGRGPLSRDPSLGQAIAIPWPSPDCPLTQGMSAQGMTAIPSLCPLPQGMGSKGWHSSPESEPLRQLQGMGWVRMTSCALQRLYADHILA